MSEIERIKLLIAESEGVKLSNWNGCTISQREAYARIESNGREWLASLITTIESQYEVLQGATEIANIAGARIKELEAKVESQKKEIETYKRTCEEGNASIKDYEIEAKGVEDHIYALTNERDNVWSEIESLQKDNRRLTEALDDYAAIISSHEYEIESQKEEIDKRHLIHEDYRRTALERIEHQEQQIESLQKEINRLKGL